MKTLESILNSPERRLSAEEMRDLKGGKFACSCNGVYVGDADSAMGCVKLCGWGVALVEYE